GPVRRAVVVTERDIFMRAFQEPDPAARRALLDRPCGPDPGLRERVEGLLSRAAQAGSFLESPAIEAFDTATHSPTSNGRAAGHVAPATPIGTAVGPYTLT